MEEDFRSRRGEMRFQETTLPPTLETDQGSNGQRSSRRSQEKRPGRHSTRSCDFCPSTSLRLLLLPSHEYGAEHASPRKLLADLENLDLDLMVLNLVKFDSLPQRKGDLARPDKWTRTKTPTKCLSSSARTPVRCSPVAMPRGRYRLSVQCRAGGGGGRRLRTTDDVSDR